MKGLDLIILAIGLVIVVSVAVGLTKKNERHRAKAEAHETFQSECANKGGFTYKASRYADTACMVDGVIVGAIR